MFDNSKWIRSPEDTAGASVEFYRPFILSKPVKCATLSVSSVGMYIPFIGGARVGNQRFTPYFTSYNHRLQYQTYDVFAFLAAQSTEVELCFLLAEGQAVGRWGINCDGKHRFFDHVSLIYALDITYIDGSRETIISDENTRVRSSHILFSKIFDGEIIDYTAQKREIGAALPDSVDTKLIPQEGPEVKEQEKIAPMECLADPSGKRIIDFGQNMETVSGTNCIFYCK